VGVQRATIHEAFVRATFPDAEVVSTTRPTMQRRSRRRPPRPPGRQWRGARAGLPQDRRRQELSSSSAPAFFDPSSILGYGAGIAVRKEDTALRNAFNQALKDIRADGTYKKINDKYFSFDVFGPD